MPVAKFTGQITPRTAGSGNPEHGLHKQAVIGGATALVSRLARQQVFNALPLSIAKQVSIHLQTTKGANETTKQ